MPAWSSHVPDDGARLRDRWRPRPVRIGARPRVGMARVFMLCTVLGASTACAQASGSQSSSHGHHAAHGAVHLAPPPAVPWPADAALRDGMGRIHAAIDAMPAHVGDNTALLQDVARVQQAARDIFTKCQLPEARDAVLHGMLVPLLAAAQALHDNPRDVTRIDAMRSAIESYPRFFDAPHWPQQAAH